MSPNPYLEALDELGADDMFDQDDMFGDEDGDDDGDDEISGVANAAIHGLARYNAAAAAGVKTALKAATFAKRRKLAAVAAARRRKSNVLASARPGYPNPRSMPSSYRQELEKARGDDVIFGIDSGSAGINGAVTASLSASPQKRNLPVKISLTQNIANSFVCSDIRVGVEPILATTSNISLAIFVQDSTAPKFRAVVNEVGMDFTIEVTNITGANARFVCTVTGVYVAPWVRPW